MGDVNWSAAGAQFDRNSATRQLMDDLGEVQRGDTGLINLGGGNPARVPAVHEMFARRLAELATSRRLDQAFAAYEDPMGPAAFRAAFAAFLRKECDWPVTTEHVLCTAGSQSSLFMLFNALGGPDTHGRTRRIMLPQSPEYIGYENLCFAPDALRGFDSCLVKTGEHRFRYTLDRERIRFDDDTAAICLSRPTNPTGQVCADQDMAWLAAESLRRDVPLIVDCAYGEPFPGISFKPSHLAWQDNLVACFSLSKLGLPGLRLGVVVARPGIIRVLSTLNATMVLTANPLAAHLVQTLFEDGSLRALVRDEIRPFYRARAALAAELCDEAFAGLDYALHEPEGAIFLWARFPGLGIDSQALYRQLKEKGVLVIPGQHFAPGRAEPHPHLRECLRISYAQPQDALTRGIALIREAVTANRRRA